MNVSKAPVVFIHGMWLHATPCGPWVDLFREAGYEIADLTREARWSRYPSQSLRRRSDG
jgi:hypothetical protein